MLGKATNLYQSLTEAARLSGRTRASIVRDLRHIRGGSKYHLGMTEYFDLGLFRREWYAASALRDFAGWRLIGLIQKTSNVNSQPWRIFGNDKLAMYQLCQANGLPVPTSVAYLSRAARHASGLSVYQDPEALLDELIECGHDTLFAKPVNGRYGGDAHVLTLTELPQGQVDVTTSAGTQQLSRVAYAGKLRKHLDDYPGMLFQVCLQPDPVVAELGGGSLSGLRVGIVKRNDRARSFATVFKVNLGGNITDNFEHGYSGNLLANIDLETGTVNRVIQGYGAAASEITVHPVTGQRILGFQVPGWDRVVQLSSQAVEMLPGIRLTGVDIALTDRGPVLLEINLPGDFDLLQLASRRGVLADPDIKALVSGAAS